MSGFDAVPLASSVFLSFSDKLRSVLLSFSDMLPRARAQRLPPSILSSTAPTWAAGLVSGPGLDSCSAALSTTMCGAWSSRPVAGPGLATPTISSRDCSAESLCRVDCAAWDARSLVLVPAVRLRAIGGELQGCTRNNRRKWSPCLLLFLPPTLGCGMARTIAWRKILQAYGVCHCECPSCGKSSRGHGWQE